MRGKYLAFIHEEQNTRRELIINAGSFEKAEEKLNNLIDYGYSKDEVLGWELIDLDLIEEIE